MSKISNLSLWAAANLRWQRSLARMRVGVYRRCMVTAAAFLATVIFASPLPGTTAYVGLYNFYEVDLSTGAGVPIGPNPSYAAFDFMPGTANLFGAVPIGGGDYSLAALSPSTNSFTLVGPTFSLGGQVPSEMTFDDTGNNAFVIDPLGRIAKIDLVNSTVATIRGATNSCFAFGTQFSCSGIAWLNGQLSQVGLPTDPTSRAIRYYTVDPVTGGVISFQDGLLPDVPGSYQNGSAWLDALGGTLYLGVSDSSGRLGFKTSVSWGIADPTTGVFTKLSDNQLPVGQLPGGLAVVETVPEPSSLGLAGVGFALLLGARFRTRFRRSSARPQCTCRPALNWRVPFGE